MVKCNQAESFEAVRSHETSQTQDKATVRALGERVGGKADRGSDAVQTFSDAPRGPTRAHGRGDFAGAVQAGRSDPGRASIGGRAS